MASVFQRAVKFLSIIENIVKSIKFRFPSENLALAPVNFPASVQNNYEIKSVAEILKESILWAVPKKRRSIERRRSRRFGYPNYYYKILLPKTNILICSECGSYKEAGLLCPNCYAKIREITKEMQEAIQNNLGLLPVENEVVVLYSDDKKQNPEFYKGMRVVEIKKERPKLFSDNLLQKSTKVSDTTQEVVQKKELS